MKDIFSKLCNKYDLGGLMEEPVIVTGGLMHKMYKVVTGQGSYAVKVLNPDIMKRSEALQNMINSERVSNQLREVVSLIAAKEFGNHHVPEEGGMYFMVFDWIEGKPIYAPEIREYHCEQIGRMLGKIHAADIRIDGIKKEVSSRKAYNWSDFLKEAEVQNIKKNAGEKREDNPEEDWISLFEKEVPHIIRWDIQVTESQEKLAGYQVISHRDLDPKNVMWKEKNPYIIDWEAAGYVNPYQELVEVLNYWIVDAEGTYDYGMFQALIKAYTESMDISAVDWEDVLKCSYDGMLGWLEYNIKRALGLTGSREEDRREGRQQVIGTIGELKRYEAQTEQLKEWLMDRQMCLTKRNSI